jgi:hypothetical protein
VTLRNAWIVLLTLTLSGAASGAGPAPVVLPAGSARPGPAALDSRVAEVPESCVADANNVFNVDPNTGKYVLYHYDASKLTMLEQGTGQITMSGSVLELSHKLASIEGFETLHAAVDTAANTGHVSVYGADEAHGGSYERFAIDDANITGHDFCATYSMRPTLNEGVLRYIGSSTSGAVGAVSTLKKATLLQRYSLNSGFDGGLLRMTFGISVHTGDPSRDLAFTPVVYSDVNGKPGNILYRGDQIQGSNVPAYPGGYLFQQRLNLKVADSFWVGYEHDPQTDPVFSPYGSDPSSARADIALCDDSGVCSIFNQPGSQYASVRNLLQSVDWEFSDGFGSKGFTLYDLFSGSDILSSKCRSAYIRIDNGSTGIYSLYSEGGSGGLAVGGYENAFARITRIGEPGATGFDGGKFSSYSGTPVYAFSYTLEPNVKFCTRRIDFIDWTCQNVPGYAPGSGGYTRTVPIESGFELSWGNGPKDWIDRVRMNMGSSGWTAQTLPPVTSTSGIVNSQYGGPWYAAATYRIGDSYRTAYEYKNVQGKVELKYFDGDQALGTVHIAEDVQNGFGVGEASRMAASCSWGRCLVGRYETKTGNNVVDFIDFTGSSPSVESYSLGAGLKGIGFGRAAYLRGNSAYYADYTTSPTVGQVRLQLTTLNLDTDLKLSASYDYATSGGDFPLSLSYDDGDLALGHRKGVDTYTRDAGGCMILPVFNRMEGGLGAPCNDTATVGGRP